MSAHRHEVIDDAESAAIGTAAEPVGTAPGSLKRAASGVKDVRWALNRICLEARAGIEPACKDLQSSASPLRHRAPKQQLARLACHHVVKAGV